MKKYFKSLWKKIAFWKKDPLVEYLKKRLEEQKNEKKDKSV